MVGVLLPQSLDSVATEEMVCPRFSIMRCVSCITLWSRHAAIAISSNHHLKYSAFWKIQCLVMSRLSFIQPSTIISLLYPRIYFAQYCMNCSAAYLAKLSFFNMRHAGA